MQKRQLHNLNDKPDPDKKDLNRSGVSPLSIAPLSLPKTGGAMKAIDEKFTVNAANGTVELSVLLPITPGRNGLQPQLILRYSSGLGNSAYGLGWDIDCPAIQRKTDKKLPQYFDAGESDVFMLSGAEDLVPVLKQVGDNWIKDEETTGGYKIRRFRPRIEGMFARIERIQPVDGNTFYWKTTTTDNIVTFFGLSAASRIQDPRDPSRIFKWLPEITFDDKGNCIIYAYKEENLDNIINTLHEKNRLSGLASFTNQYIKRVKYGNIRPYYPGYPDTNAIYRPPIPVEEEFLFELLFDYGEHSGLEYKEAGPWIARKDPFSDYRSGFEIRTWRLCQRIMMFHHFTNREFGLAEDDQRVPYLVKSLDMEYMSSSENSSQPSQVTYLKLVRQTGYKKQPVGYFTRSLPPLEFSYQLLNWNKEIKVVSPENIVDAPEGLGGNYDWTDLFNEGIPGILTEQGTGWYYKSNLGNGEFSNAQLVSPKPSFTGLAAGTLRLEDLDADGNRQIVSSSQGLHGYYELTDDDSWNRFQSFERIPAIDWQSPNMRRIDLQGDGRSDLLISEDNSFTWYPSAGKKGYDSSEVSTKPFDENKGPAIVFADEKQTVFLADMCGDGLTDIVRIRNGEVCYWPNLGYGRFGAKVAMSNAPFFDHPDQFNPSFIHLADISGTGVTDILYLGKNSFSAWLNLGGNSWSDQCSIDPFFTTEHPNEITVVDLLGNGTSCVVWSSPLPGNAHEPIRYIDLMGGVKPHIMKGYKNNFGKEVAFRFKSSTHYYLDDKKNGRPWISKLPFPVQCLSQVVVTDLVADLRFTNEYKYHHGYFDHAEREFRGFGMVEQTDTEEFELLQSTDASNATDKILHEPPVLTKMWFHLGNYTRIQKILDIYKSEYWYSNSALTEVYGSLEGKEYRLPDVLFIGEMNAAELREAHRACKGMTLREEIFALDGTEKELLPYSVTTHNCHIKKMQPLAGNPFAVFAVYQSEAVTFSYERTPDDPRVAHSLNIEIDDHGNVLKGAVVVYSRKHRPPEITDDRIWEEQNKTHITITENSFTTDIIQPDVYRLRLPFEVKQYELTGIEPSSGEYFSISDFPADVEEIGFEATPGAGLMQKRCIEHIKTIYLNDNLIDPLTEGEHGAGGFTLETYQLAFTTALLDDIYNSDPGSPKVNAAMLSNSKYVDLNTDGNWWIRSGSVQYIHSGEVEANASARFYAPQSYTDPFGAKTTVSYYSNYYILLQQTKDVMENVTIAERYDFRVLSPSRVKDINANITEAAFDALGRLAGIAMMGKGNEADSLEDFLADLSQSEIDGLMNDPVAHGKDLLKRASSRIVYDFSGIPCVAANILREEYDAVNPDSRLQYSFEYYDGLDHVTLKKIQTSPGEDDLPRWVGNGRTILNNKGQPVKQYEPYFSTNHSYEDEPLVRETGVTPILHYDSMGRLVKTIFPDDTFSRIEFNSWKETRYDRNDTVLESKWYSDRIGNLLNTEFTADGKDPEKEKAAAAKTAIHNNTPTVIHLDPVGRVFYKVDHNKRAGPIPGTAIEEFYATLTVLDIENNVRSIIDACNNTVIRFKYDMLGHQAFRHSMDAGNRWMLNDSMGQPQYAWDNKESIYTTVYDDLHRPVTTTLSNAGNDFVTDRQQYVDTKNLSAAELSGMQSANLIGKSVVQYDNAGVLKTIRCDFMGNVLESTRQLCNDYDVIPNWTVPAAVDMDDEIFMASNEFDALGRQFKNVAAHTASIPASAVNFRFNETSQVDHITANIRENPTAIEFVSGINYDAKGQKEKERLANNTVTKYIYDRKTYRLIQLLTTTDAGNKIFQDLRYTYDPVGNITHIHDQAQQPLFFDGQRIDAVNEFEYDAIYQLINASGREHAGQNVINETATNNNSQNFSFQNGINPNDLQALRNYSRQYLYDAVGNILQSRHIAAGDSWTREYLYNNNDADRNELSIDPAKPKNNQLLQTQIGDATPVTYSYDVHGNTLNQPHLAEMIWNYKDQLMEVDLGGGGKAYYIYDRSGQRARKVIERIGGLIEERIYLGPFEVYRRTQNNNTIEEETQTLHIMNGESRVALIDIKTVKDNVEIEANNLEILQRFQYSDYLGSACLELNEHAEMISYEEYHPFGTTSFIATNSNIKAAAKRYRYTNMERDDETGMGYHTLRYYLNWIGRWLSTDPIGTNDGLNLYRYCNNNPIDTLDRNGTDKYAAQKKDNLSKIASKFDTTVDKLLELNPGLGRNSVIGIGQKINVPGKAKPAAAPKAKPAKVKPPDAGGDTAKPKAAKDKPAVPPAPPPPPKPTGIAPGVVVTNPKTPAATTSGGTKIAIVMHNDPPAAGKTKNNEYDQNERALRKQGYVIFEVKDGKQLLDQLEAWTKAGHTIGVLVLLTHGIPEGLGGLLRPGEARRTGLYVDKTVEGYNPKYATTLGDFEARVKAGKISFTKDAEVYIAGCRSVGGEDHDGVKWAGADKDSFAYQLAKKIGVTVYGSKGRASFRPEDNDSSSAGKDTLYRRTSGEWHKIKWDATKPEPDATTLTDKDLKIGP